MMKPNRETKKAEAIKWMNILGIQPEVISNFKEHDTIALCSGKDGSFSPLVDNELKALIDKFEQQRENVVYLVVRTPSIYGQLDSLLFVGNYSEEWEFTKEELRSGYVLTYTINRNYPECSEMGDIFVKRSTNGGLIRLN